FQTVSESPARNTGLHAEARQIAPQGIGPDLMSPTISFADRCAVNRAESSLADRFAMDRSDTSTPAPVSFADRFRGEVMASRAPVRSAVAMAPTTVTAAPRRTA